MSRFAIGYIGKTSITVPTHLFVPLLGVLLLTIVFIPRKSFANLPNGVQGGTVGGCDFRVITSPDGTVKIYLAGDNPDEMKVITVKDGKACISQQLNKLNPKQLASVRDQLKSIWNSSPNRSSQKESAIRDAYSALNQIENTSQSASLVISAGATR